jgi:hypothetical protein
MKTTTIGSVRRQNPPPNIQRDGEVLTAEVKLPREDLENGPMGCSLYVVDYDASIRKMYRAAQVKHGPPQLKKRDEILSDPVFHAWNVYAIVMRTLMRFESALGRRVRWGIRGHQLKAVPHAFEDANAFYSPDAEALLFGYIRDTGGAGNTYLCLSHDVVAHETAHALLDGLRGDFIVPSSADQAALHEAFADIVALLSVFSLPEVVEYLIDPGGDRDTVDSSALSIERLQQTDLFGLAENIGNGSGSRIARVDALRRSVRIKPRPGILCEDEYQEEHRRGEVFVGAVMRTFLQAWKARIDFLAVGERGRVSRQIVAEQGADIAELLLTMCIRAIDYTPPIHITFSHFLSAMLTADLEVRTDDSRYHLRDTLRDVMAQFGITGASLDANGYWVRADTAGQLTRGGAHFTALQTDDTEMFRHIWNNRRKLRLNSHAFTQIASVRPCVRVSPSDGFQIRETVVECGQYLKISAADLPVYGLDEVKLPLDTPIELRGGSTLILDEYGDLKYEISDKLPSPKAMDKFDKSSAAARRRLRERWNDRIQYLYCSGHFTGQSNRAALLAALHRDRSQDHDLDAVAEIKRRQRNSSEEWR